MSFITIQCRLVANEEIRQLIWHLMADKNTPLVNELLKQVSQDDNFENWQVKGIISEQSVRQLCALLKTEPQFACQPGRFYTSASLMVSYTYQSWFAVQQKYRRRLEGKQRWLNIVKSDEELVKVSGHAISAIKDRAQEILTELETQLSDKQNQSKKKRKKKEVQQQIKA